MEIQDENVAPMVRIRAADDRAFLKWREIYEYRDMLRFLVIRDFISKYKQTILGPLWFIIQPLFLGLIFTVVFGRVAGLSTDGTPKFLFYLAGQLGWTYFQACFNATAGNLVNNAQLFKKVYFPRIIVPLATIISNLLAFFIQLLSFVGFWVYFKFWSDGDAQFGLAWSVTMLPLLVLQTAAISLGAGLWMAALSAKYRDLHHVTPFLVQAFLYITPIIYPLSEVPEQYRWLVALNPLTAVVEGFRHAFLGVATVGPTEWALSIAVTVVLCVSGIMFYTRIQRNFVDYA